MSDWVASSLADVAEIGAGNSAPQDERLFKNGIYPFIRTSDVGQIRFGSISTAADLLNEEGIKGLRLFPKGTILMPKSGASTFLNHRVQMSTDGYVSSHLATVRARPEVCDGRFLLYYLSTVRAQDLIQDHRYPSLTLETIGEIPISLPSLHEQKRIIAVLDEAFAALDRVRANAEANRSAAADLIGSAVAAMFNRLAHSKTLPLAAVSDFEGGSQPPKSEFAYEPRDGYIRLLQIRDFTSDEKAVYIADDGKRRRCEREDIMIARYGASVGQIHRGKQGCYNVALIKTIPNTKLIDRDYFYYYLKSDLFQKALLARSSRGAQDGFNKADIADFKVPLPEIGDQKAAVIRVRQIEERAMELCRHYESALCSERGLRRSLLHAAFSGQLT